MKNIKYVLLNIFTLGLFNLILAYKMNLYDENAWYNKWQYWFFSTLCLIFPVFLLLIVFIFQINISVAKKLKVKGSNIYYTPYSWIICLVVPLVGWSLLLVMTIYLFVFTNIKLLGVKEW